MQRTPVLFAILALAFFILHGAKTISLDTDAQAGIAYLFLPFYALIPAITGWGLGKTVQLGWKNRTSTLAIWLCSGVGIALIVALFGMYSFASEARSELIAFQQQEERTREQFRADVKANREHLRQRLSENPGQEATILEQEFATAASTSMRLAIAQNEFTPPDLLDQLARVDEIVVVNNVLSHPATGPDTLAWIFLNYVAQDEDGYGKFLEANLSKHPKATPGLLRDIYNSGQFYSPKSLLKNPNLPADIRQNLQN